jgi:ubiquinone biosynthesis UbiH/UbiF/VisC/COQ6 family hydroxylase
MLRELGVALPPARLAAVRAMQIFGDDGHSRLDFNGGQPLAAVVEHAVLMQALQAALLRDGRAVIRRGLACVEMCLLGENRRELTLSDGSRYEPDLLIAADGSRSQIRQWAGIAAAVKDYGSDGVVANFRTAIPHGDIARQWFSPEGVLAYLPLPGSHISIVWSVSKEMSAALPSNDPAAFCRAVERAGQSSLGALALVSPIARFPLSRITADSWVQPGLALIGDAAHAVHPLAGQGVNLGFADVRHLSAALRGRSKFSAIGDLAVLRRYERCSREAAGAVGQMTDQLRSLYRADSASAHWLRNDGVNWLNRLPAGKSLLIDYASR